MKIEAVDLFYLSMPVIHDIGDGSQDALLVRVRASDLEGWGECEAAPLVSIAGFVCPPSHSACKPVSASVLGQRLDSAADIRRIGEMVRANSADLLQADHVLSGLDVAMWDLLGKRFEMPVYELLGHPVAYPKVPYASQLFGEDPDATLRQAQSVRSQGFAAAKFGWGPFGRGTPEDDGDQLAAAREGLGADATLLVDAGTVWGSDVAAAEKRIRHLNDQRVLFLEEPFVPGALHAYRALSSTSRPLQIAGGEGCHDYFAALHMLEHAGLDYIQIDTGRTGITVAAQIAEAAGERGITYLNHTFTSHLALSASLQPFAGMEDTDLCEYPVAAKPLADELTTTHLTPDADGRVRLPDAPGLGLEIDPDTVKKYLQDVQVEVGGTVLYRTPDLFA